MRTHPPKRGRGAVARSLGLSLGLVAVLGAGTYLTLRRPPAPPPAASEGARAWPSGQRLRYDLTLSTRTQANLAAGNQGVDVALSLQADVRVDVLPPAPGAPASESTLALSFERVRQQRLLVSGKEQPQQGLGEVERLIVGPRAFVTVDGRGRVLRIAFEKDVNPAARQGLEQLGRHLGFLRPGAGDGATWQGEEDSAFGRRRASYSREAAEGRAVRLVRRSQRYESVRMMPRLSLGAQDLKGSATVRLDPSGAVTDLDDEEVLTVRGDGSQPGQPVALLLQTSLSLHRRDLAEPLASGELPQSLEEYKGPAQRPADPDRERRRDERLAKDVTIESVASLLAVVGAGGSPQQGEAQRAAAYLRLHPERCADIKRLFDKGTIKGSAQGLALDILSMAGHPVAQSTLREILSLPSLRRESKDYVMLVQRMTFVTHPTVDSARFLNDVYRNARSAGDDNVARGAVTSLGATIHNLRARGAPAEADALEGQLRASLLRASGPAERAGLVAALGNAGGERSAEAILAVRGDKSTDVRDEVAHALRNFRTDEARHALVELAADGDVSVSRSAFGSLRNHRVDPEDWSALRQSLDGGRIPKRADSALLDLIARQGATGDPQAQAILKAVAERAGYGDPYVRSTAKELLTSAAPR